MDELKERIRKKEGKHPFYKTLESFIDDLDDVEEYIIVAKRKERDYVYNTVTERTTYLGMLEVAKQIEGDPVE